jgi:hypothetical protein
VRCIPGQTGHLELPRTDRTPKAARTARTARTIEAGRTAERWLGQVERVGQAGQACNSHRAYVSQAYNSHRAISHRACSFSQTYILDKCVAVIGDISQAYTLEACSPCSAYIS